MGPGRSGAFHAASVGSGVGGCYPVEVSVAPAGEDSRAAELLRRLQAQLHAYGSLLVCFSGGIDSTLVLAVAHRQLGARAIGLTAVSPSLPERDRQEAIRIASEIGARHELVGSNEMQRPEYVANGPDRCFHCKTELYELAEAKRKQWGLRHVANGTNTDDVGDYRPGLEAAKRAAVESPLQLLGFSKQDVRDVARLVGVPSWNKPAAACLSSRLPYGTSVTPERLRQVEQLEAKLADLGFRQSRVRWHDSIARIEVGGDELVRLADPSVRGLVVEAGRQCGFLYVTADLAGYRVGSHNEALAPRRLPVV